MRKTKDLRANKGITLIALVITIIVMLILVGVTISMAVNGGLFDYAGRAAKGTNDKLREEGQLAEGQIEVDGEWYGSINEYLNKDKERISKETSYIGYYADVDGNGTVDGVIYADLAFGSEEDAGWWTGFSYEYEATSADKLKNYYVSKTNYEGDFGTKDVLAPIGSGKDRFYVMALENLTTEEYTSFYWYKNAKGNLSDYATATDTAFGKGKANTIKIKEYWEAEIPYGTQDTRDVWEVIDSYDIVESVEDSGKWFLPSKGEIDAFADAFNVNVVFDGDGNPRAPYGLPSGCLTSSLKNDEEVWYPYLDAGGWGHSSVDEARRVRLSATY